MSNCAIHFLEEAFVGDPKRIFGRHSAGRGFLEGFFRHSGADRFYCCAATEDAFARFRDIVATADRQTPTEWIPYSGLSALSSVGCLYHPDPHLGRLAWQRQRLGPVALSLCGVTHTICTMEIMDAIGDLLIAPIQPWDALVCTSTAARSVVQHVLAEWGVYLQAKFRADRLPSVELPVIPLGVDCNTFVPNDRRDNLGSDIRKRLNIGTEDVAVLYAGRLSAHAKAHPLPMFSALEAVAVRTQTRLHLMLFGWFSNSQIRDQFVVTAREFCPSVKVHFLDGKEEWYEGIWHAADIFMSLSDNIQETFGLTPLEAMAAGLPVIVSDWNGYRDTVRDGVDGFRIETTMPPSDAGSELALRYSTGLDNYDRYVGNVSQSVAVDIPKCVKAIEALVADKETRATMGESARRHAKNNFDWSVIVPSYQELWRELAARRESMREEIGKVYNVVPQRDDPFAVFAGYATRPLDSDTMLVAGPNLSDQRIKAIATMPINTVAMNLMCSGPEIVAILEAVVRNGQTPVESIARANDAGRRSTVLRTIGWLLKMGILSVHR